MLIIYKHNKTCK